MGMNIHYELSKRYTNAIQLDDMKNEPFFANLVLAKVKKRYLSKVLLREGNLLKNQNMILVNGGDK